MGVSLDVCLCLHAEENAIIEAGSSRCENATLYSSLFPCLACTKLIMQVSWDTVFTATRPFLVTCVGPGSVCLSLVMSSHTQRPV
mmetsp:Transcript_5745/g.24223  ORF Transcript_5745/g.24223 Transcript_5745/m.24223 type:complete len:85 (+) Transcript_5745:871-1125(+)